MFLTAHRCPVDGRFGLYVSRSDLSPEGSSDVNTDEPCEVGHDGCCDFKYHSSRGPVRFCFFNFSSKRPTLLHHPVVVFLLAALLLQLLEWLPAESSCNVLTTRLRQRDPLDRLLQYNA